MACCFLLALVQNAGWFSDTLHTTTRPVGESRYCCMYIPDRIGQYLALRMCEYTRSRVLAWFPYAPLALGKTDTHPRRFSKTADLPCHFGANDKAVLDSRGVIVARRRYKYAHQHSLVAHRAPGSSNVRSKPGPDPAQGQCSSLTKETPRHIHKVVKRPQCGGQTMSPLHGLSTATFPNLHYQAALFTAYRARRHRRSSSRGH